MPVLGLRSRVVVSLLWFLCAFVGCGPDKKGIRRSRAGEPDAHRRQWRRRPRRRGRQRRQPARAARAATAGGGGAGGSGGSTGTLDAPAGHAGWARRAAGPARRRDRRSADRRGRAPMEAAGAIPDPIYTGPPRCYLQAIIRDFRASGDMRHPDFESPGSWGNDVCAGPGRSDAGGGWPVRQPAGSAPVGDAVRRRRAGRQPLPRRVPIAAGVPAAGRLVHQQAGHELRVRRADPAVRHRPGHGGLPQPELLPHRRQGLERHAEGPGRRAPQLRLHHPRPAPLHLPQGPDLHLHR